MIMIMDYHKFFQPNSIAQILKTLFIDHHLQVTN